MKLCFMQDEMELYRQAIPNPEEFEVNGSASGCTVGDLGILVQEVRREGGTVVAAIALGPESKRVLRIFTET
jgi:hypothetical protein